MSYNDKKGKNMLKFLSYVKSKRKLSREFLKDEQGNPYLEIEVHDKSEVVSPYSVDGKQSINVEFASLLDNVGKSLSPKDKLHLNIKTENWKDEETEDFSLAIKNYFANSLIETQRKISKNFKIFWIMVAFSLLFIGALFLADYFSAPFIVTEVIDIITWGFVWEAVDVIAFQRTLYRYELEHDQVIYNMKITYDSPAKRKTKKQNSPKESTAKTKNS